MEIYTVGHSNIPINEFLELLKKHYIDSVADVRSLPVSTYASQYDKGAIDQFLNQNNIKYLYMGNRLGGKIAEWDCCDNGVADYGIVAGKQWYKTGLYELLDHAEKHRTAIMCAEENPYHCHRHFLLTQTILSKGVRVYHIRGDGRLEEAEKDDRQARISSFF